MAITYRYTLYSVCYVVGNLGDVMPSAVAVKDRGVRFVLVK